AYGGLFFDEDDLIAVISKVERRLNSSDASPNYQSPFADRNFSAAEGFQQGGPGHGHFHQVGSFAGRGVGFVYVNPTALLTQVGHFEHVSVETGVFEHLPECWFMEPWRAGSDHNAVKSLFGNIFLNAL